MKKFAFLLLVLSAIILLFGCNTPADMESDVSSIENDVSSTESDVSSVESDVSNTEVSDEKTVSNIVNLAEQNGYFTSQVAENFYFDEQYIYTFRTLVSNYIIVHYTDGTQDNVKNALRKGHITISDLDRFDIDYITTPNHIEKIVDLTKTEEYERDDQSRRETFFADDEFYYFFNTTKSTAIKVHFKDGTTQPLKFALEEGKVRITDLDRFRVMYYKSAINGNLKKEILEFIGGGEAWEYSDYSDGYYIYHLNSKKNDATTVVYTDGSRENIADALKNKNLTLSDLEKYDITYTKNPLDRYPDEKMIKNIIDDTLLFDIITPDEVEEFYSEDGFVYTFPSLKSEHVIVYYTTGMSEPITDALKSGRIKITDLDRYDIEYRIEAVGEPYVVDIVDLVAKGEKEMPSGTEHFYNTTDREYVFVLTNSESVIVHYSDGTTQNVKEALKSGRINIDYLDRYGIRYIVKPKYVKRIVDQSTSLVDLELLPFEDVIYNDGEYLYTFQTNKSGFVQVFHNDVTRHDQTVKAALASGVIRIEDLAWYGISYDKIRSDGTREEKELLKIVNWNELGYDDSFYIYSVIFTDEKYEYYLEVPYKDYKTQDYIIAYYSDGTAQRIDVALQEGNITIDDLDKYGIKYTTQPVPPYHEEIKDIVGGAPKQPRDAKEIFWSDDNYCYVFPKVQSRNIYVNYKDKKRSQQMLKEALADGSITLSDLELFGFKFTKEPLGKYSDKKTVSDIVNLAFLYGFDLPDCEEIFYQDDENEYTFGQIMSDCIIVYYTDGTGEYLVDALESGHIKITDLDKFGIGYRKESNSR